MGSGTRSRRQGCVGDAQGTVGNPFFPVSFLWEKREFHIEFHTREVREGWKWPVSPLTLVWD